VHKDLDISDLGDLVEQPLVAVLATYRLDGSVLLSPVWHEYRDGGFNVCTSTGDVKVRHLRRDPRAVLLVAESEPPYRGVELTCEATIDDRGARETLLRIAVRYLGEAAARTYVETLSDDVVLRLVPGQVRAWDFADTF
jgi:PPOX class probable F420-dependent enzyme